MNAKRAFAQILCMLAVSTTSAHAGVFITLVIGNPSQVGQTSSASVPFEVRASTDNGQVSVLTVGGGLTLTCEGGLTPIKPNTANSFSIPPIGEKSVSVPGTHTVGGYTNWQNGSLHDCTVHYRGSAAEGATGTSGTGYDFVFQVGSLVQGTSIDDKTFTMKKFAGGGGCLD